VWLRDRCGRWLARSFERAAHVQTWAARSRSAFAITDTELNLMVASASTGLSRRRCSG
jgi:hypothetical protein